MTEIMSAAAATARETHRQSTGQFGTQPRDEAELELTADTTSDQLSPDTRCEQLTTAWETAAQAADDAQQHLEELSAVYLPASAARDERTFQRLAAEREVQEDLGVAQKATEALYAFHGARYARHYASDVAERAESAGWKLKVKRGGPDAAATRAARDAAANDPLFTAAVANHAKSVAAREELAAQHREPNLAFAALQREYSPAAERARTLRAQAERARVELERHQQIREAGLVGDYELANPTGLREIHVTEHGTNVWARRTDDNWSRIVDVERHFDFGGTVVRFHYDDGTAETSHTHYGQGRTTNTGPTELAVATPAPGATVLTGSFVGESDSTG